MARPRKPTPISVGNVGAPDASVSLPGGDGGDSANGYISIDPSAVPDPDSFGAVGGSSGDSGSAAGSDQPKRRGRKPGTSNRAKGAALDIAGLGNIILNFHTLLAAVTRAPELLMSEEESNELAKATSQVARHYNVEVAAKTTDWINLALVAGGIYAPRLTAMGMRRADERKSNGARPVAGTRAAPQPERATVTVSEAPDLGPLDAFGFPMGGFN